MLVEHGGCVMDEMKQRGVRFSDTQWGAVERAAERIGVSASALVRMAVAEKLSGTDADAFAAWSGQGQD